MEKLMPLVYDELRGLARHYMRGEREEHTLQATALVHEAYARLVRTEVAWSDRTHFFKAAAGAMRRVLVDSARARRSAKRGGDRVKVSLSEVAAGPSGTPIDLVDLNHALEALEAEDPRKVRAIELYFFVGLEHAEVAQVLDVSPATVDRDLRFAKAWLKSRLAVEEHG
jgi:RNA polymerase sigma factor (TIGR02999 family)